MIFSIVCSVFNSEKYIKDCLNSIISCSFSDWELIILDDGSTDSTGLICDNYAKMDSRIKVYHNNNVGPYNERIKGFLLSKGEYILNIDADDSFCANIFDTLLTIISNSNPDLIIFNENAVSEKANNKLDTNIYNEMLLHDKNEIFKNYFKNYLLMQGLHRKCFKRSLLDNAFDLSPRDSRMFEDGLFSLKILNASNNVFFCNECLYNYREINDESLTKKFKKYNSFDFGIVLEKMIMIDDNSSLEKQTKADCLSQIILLLINYVVFMSKNGSTKKQIKNLRNNETIKKILKFNVSKRRLGKRRFVLFAFANRQFTLLKFLCGMIDYEI